MKIIIKKENCNGRKKKRDEALNLKRLFRFFATESSSTGAAAGNYFSGTDSSNKKKFDNAKKK